MQFLEKVYVIFQSLYFYFTLWANIHFQRYNVYCIYEMLKSSKSAHSNVQYERMLQMHAKFACQANTSCHTA